MANLTTRTGGPALGRAAAWAAGLCAIVLLACKGADRDRRVEAEAPPKPSETRHEPEPPGDQPAETSTTSGAVANKAAAASNPAAAAVQRPSFRITPVPEIPEGRSNPPQGTEWDQGVPVNTQGANSRGQKCSMHILREWLRIYCCGKVIGYEKMEDFGTLQSDYYEKIVPGKYASFVVRLRKGKSQKIRICREGDRASLFVNWPPSRDKPVHVALSQGPPCDGSDWGVGYGKKPGGAARYNPDEHPVNDAELDYGEAMQQAAGEACRQGVADACLAACGKQSCP